MITPEVFLQAPLRGEFLDKYFVDRERDLEYVVKRITRSTEKIIGVLGKRGSGKTTFLYAVERIYTRLTGKEDILYIRADEIIGQDYSKLQKEIEKSNISVLLIDDVAELVDKEALKFYDTIYRLSVDTLANIVYTDTTKRSSSSLSKRRWINSGRELSMDLGVEGTKNILAERLKKGGIEDLFTNSAMQVLAIRSGGNLRLLFTYAEECYLITEKEKGISEEEAKRVIREMDERIISTLSPLARDIMQILIQSPWMNTKQMMFSLRERAAKSISNRDIYEALKELNKMGIIIHKISGNEKRWGTIYNVLGMNMDIDKERDEDFRIGL